MWLVATVSISTETIKSVCSCLATLALVNVMYGSLGSLGTRVYASLVTMCI